MIARSRDGPKTHFHQLRELVTHQYACNLNCSFFLCFHRQNHIIVVQIENISNNVKARDM